MGFLGGSAPRTRARAKVLAWQHPVSIFPRGAALPVGEARAAWRKSPDGRAKRIAQGRRRRSRAGAQPNRCRDCLTPLDGSTKLCGTCKGKREAARRPVGRPRTRHDPSLWQYGLSDADFVRMLLAQGGLCAICDRPLSAGSGKPQIDHDHRCCPGESVTCGGACIRGIVHGRCNRGIAQLGDDPAVYQAAARFIALHNERLGFPAGQREPGPARRRNAGQQPGLFDAAH